MHVKATEPKSTALSRRALAAVGQPIGVLMEKALAQPELISLAAGFVDQSSLPVEETDAAWRALSAEPSSAHAALQYGTTAGYRPLRELLLEEQRTADGNPDSMRDLTPEQVVVSAGSNQMLHLLAETLFDPGDIVLCASPTYFVYLGVLKSLSVRAIGVATDDDGLVPEALDERLRNLAASGQLNRVKAIYVVSYFDNPRSVTLPATRREAIVEIARRWSVKQKIYVIDDAAYRKLRYDGDDVSSLRTFDSEGDTVVLTQTFSKSFSPGIRVGWGILPRELVGPVCDLKDGFDFGSPNFSQHLMYEVVRSGACARQAAKLQAMYRHKRDAMVEACRRHFAGLEGVRWREPAGGLYVWLTLPPEIDAGLSGQLFDEALQAGVIYVPGEYSYAPEGESAAHNTIRLSFGVQSPERIAAGIGLLAAAFKRVAR